MDKKYFINTYGCQMNVHDSEKLAGIAKDIGFSPADNLNDAHLIIFNTCCIRDTAEKKIFGNIGALKKLKKEKKDIIIAILGCMTQQDGMSEIIKEKFPFVDIVMGTTNTHEFGNALKQVLADKAKKRTKIYRTVAIDSPEIDEKMPIHRSSGTNAWVNIMYGCDNFCTYCIVPYVRGRERSREPHLILAEISNLVKEGYKEITLLGQNVNSYGNDRKDGYNFAWLLAEISQLDGDFWVRFMTSHPKDLSSEVIDIIASSDKLCKSIHLPIQAGSNNVLKAMNRKYTREYYLSLVEEIREKIPECAITTDIMVGFPGETDEDFLDTLSLIETVRFSNAFTFIYSARKGTRASTMEQIPYAIKKERIGTLIALQNKISKEISQAEIGKTLKILVEDTNKQGFLCGRSQSGKLVSFAGSKELIGQFLQIKIEKSRHSTLWGTITDDK